jgi:hypothetical protein
MNFSKKHFQILYYMICPIFRINQLKKFILTINQYKHQPSIELYLNTNLGVHLKNLEIPLPLNIEQCLQNVGNNPLLFMNKILKNYSHFFTLTILILLKRHTTDTLKYIQFTNDLIILIILNR